MTNLTKTLEERGNRYGRFDGHSEITQALKRTLRGEDNKFSEQRESALALAWMRLEDDQRESLEMIAHKIGRILNGDPNYADSWADIAGYAKLVADRLEEKEHEERDKDLAGTVVPSDAVVSGGVSRENAEEFHKAFPPAILVSANPSAVRGGQRKGARTGAATRR